MAAKFVELEDKLLVLSESGKLTKQGLDSTFTRNAFVSTSAGTNSYFSFKKSSNDRNAPIFAGAVEAVDLDDKKIEFESIKPGDLVMVTFALVKYFYQKKHGLKAVPYQVTLIHSEIVSSDVAQRETVAEDRNSQSPSKGLQAPKRFRRNES